MLAAQIIFISLSQVNKQVQSRIGLLSFFLPLGDSETKLSKPRAVF